MDSMSPICFYGDSPLHVAVRQGQIEDVKNILVQQQLNVNILNSKHETPLHLACSQRTSAIVQLLIAFSADPFIRDSNDKTAYSSSYDITVTVLMNKLLFRHGLWISSPTQTNSDTPLHIAVRLGKLDKVHRILNKIVAVNSINASHETPLHLACAFGRRHIVYILMSNGADMYKKDCYNNAPIHRAVSQGHVDILDCLITDYACDPRIKGYQGRTLLHFACGIGNAALVNILIQKHGISPMATDAANQTPLHIAASHGQEEVVCLLITKYNSPVDCRSNFKLSPLHLASYCGHVSVVKTLLLEYKADMNALDEVGDTPFPKAAMGGNLDLVQMMITDFNLDPLSTACTGNTPLHMACWGGHEKLARLLITKYNAPVDAKNKMNETPLHKACSSGHLSVVRMLVVEYKANVNAHDDEYSSPLHKAALTGHADVIHFLITEFSCSPQVKGFEGRSLLHYACTGGMAELAVTLITSFNLNPLLADDRGNTPLHMACWGGHEELARLLITKHNCHADIINKHIETPLHMACLFGHPGVVKMLIFESRADRNARESQNDTPLHKAALGGHTNIVQMLITKFGCSPQVKGFKGRSLLHHACDKGKIKLAMTLITDYDLDPLSVDDSGNTPLHMACWGGHEELARLLITKHRCPVNVKNVHEQTPLHTACSFGHLGVSKVLLSKCSNKRFSTDYNTLDKDGHTPLDLVIKSGDAKAVHILSMEYGCKPHVKGAEFKPLLHQLCAGGFAKVLQELISNFNHDPASVDEEGNTLFHTAAQHGLYDIVELLIANHCNHCPIDFRNSRGQTALHCACIRGHTRVAKLLVINKADITVRDEDGDTPLKKALLNVFTLFKMFYSKIHSVFLRQVCDRGSIDMVDTFLSDFNLDPSFVLDNQGNTMLHIAAAHSHKEIIALLINKYNFPVDSKNLSGQTPLHLLCSQTPTENVDTLIKIFIDEFKADVSSRDKKGDQPIHIAAQAGLTDTVIDLILKRSCSPKSRGFKERTLLHHALAMGHTSTAKTLIDVFHLSLHSTDEDGNTPLHLSSLSRQPESVRFLLYDYHAPIYVRNKAGKIALDLAKDDLTKRVIREYIKSEHKSIQQEYEELRSKSLQKYSGQQIITRVFVLGNSGSGKSTLVESLKRKGVYYYFSVPEADVPLHTAGIVPSIHQSQDAGRLLYYDFAGDTEYFSSHAAILEMVSHSTVGNNAFLIVADLRKDGMTLCNEIGYWLSFISYHAKALDSQCQVVVVLSHSDFLSLAECASTVESIRQYLHSTHMNQCDEVTFDIVEVISLNCRLPRSSKSIESILEQVSRGTRPFGISFETTLLHGILQKDFENVVACKFQDLITHIKDTDICLPVVADALYPLVKELHDIGVLMMIGRSEVHLEDYLVLLNLSSLTNEVHRILFSDSVIHKLNSSVNPHYASMGILPESYLTSILPEHITKECLIQLQYCQEFSHAEVRLNYLVTPDDTLNNHLLYFPALCKLESERSSWPTDPKLTFSIGWYAKCTGKFDYFPARYLHVLLLRLAFAFALPIATNCNITEVSLHNRRCTMWKNGIRWLMEEGVECIFEIVNENKGIVVIMKSEERSEEWAIILGKIINKVMQAKAEFCDTVSLNYFLLNSDNTSTFMYEDKLFEISDVERVIREGKKKVVSVSGRTFLDSSLLFVLRKYTYWGQYFPMCISKVLSCVKDVVGEWERLGMALQIPYEILREIDIDKSRVSLKKEAMIIKWMDSQGPACWWLLVKALEEIELNVAASDIRAEQGEVIGVQEKLIEGGDQNPDNGFLQSFASVVGYGWPSLASLLSITAREIEEIKREEKEKQALCTLTKWNSKEEATFEQLHQKLQTVYLFQC